MKIINRVFTATYTCYHSKNNSRKQDYTFFGFSDYYSKNPLSFPVYSLGSLYLSTKKNISYMCASCRSRSQLLLGINRSRIPGPGSPNHERRVWVCVSRRHMRWSATGSLMALATEILVFCFLFVRGPLRTEVVFRAFPPLDIGCKWRRVGELYDEKILENMPHYGTFNTSKCLHYRRHS